MLAVVVLLLPLHATAGRVLITPASPTPTPPPRATPDDDPTARATQEAPCNVKLTVDEEDDALDHCSCYPSLPSACTRLLRNFDSLTGVVFPAAGTRPATLLEECGARVGAFVIPPDNCEGGYYGCDNANLDPKKVFEDGLPGRGTDWDLLNHAEQKGNSAFRGTTKLVTYPDGGGAAAWADEGGYVYEITCIPSWDVNKHLQGRRLVADLAVGSQRFGGNLVLGEHEHAIPSRVPPEHIKRCGCVVTSAAGVPFVPRSSWVDNPKWDPCFCRYSLSECDDSAVPCH